MLNKSDSHWVSISDMMTGLMVIFMFIAISYILEVNRKQAELTNIIEQYEETRQVIQTDLLNMLLENMSEYQDYIKFDMLNLNIKFIGEEIQFASDSEAIRPKFKEILDKFIPLYLEIISKPEYKDKIAEVRIEGHANKVYPATTSSYMKGVSWSQRRAKNVLNYFIQNKSFQSLSPKQKERLEFWLVANGYGYGRNIDEAGTYTLESEEESCSTCSRRVEFRIVTTSEQVVGELINKINTK